MRSELGFTTLATEVPGTKAIILPPPGGPSIITVLQRQYRNGVSQEIALSTAAMTPGQNAFYVSLINDPATDSEIDDMLKIRSLRPDAIQAEMEQRLPDVEMQTSLVYVQNKYGPFGFATGRSPAGDLCLYAWQQIEPNEPAILMTRGAISIRLRLCDRDASAEELLRAMYGFTISAYFSSVAWNPYGAPPPVPEDLGGPDAPILPPTLGRQSRTPASRPQPRPAPAVTRTTTPEPAPVSTAAPATEPARPLSDYPTVPLPPQ